MSVFTWCTQRVGGLSLLALLVLSYWVIAKELTVNVKSYSGAIPPSEREAPTAGIAGSSWLSRFLAYYALLIHLMVFAFPLRACWALWDMTSSLRRIARVQALQQFNKTPSAGRRSSSSTASSDTLAADDYLFPSDASFGDENIDPSAVEAAEFNIDEPSSAVVHVIVIPNYKEEIDTLRETLDVLASHPQARACYDVYLGMEQREADGDTKALGLINDFTKKFHLIDFTTHPSDIPGESAGKGSNVAWAALKLSENYPMEMRKNVMFTGIDADSHLSWRYFSEITQMHLSHPETATTTMYAAPIVFDRNAHLVPTIVRVADILWCAAGMSGLYRNSTIAPPTSVYSLPLELVDRVGGWDTGAEAIGEDLHMFIKCFFALNGHLTCRVINSPISQTNVTACKGGGIRGAVADVQARYKQALRHMWGALDAGFAIRKLVEVWRERKHTTRAFPPLHKNTGHDSTFYLPENQPVEAAVNPGTQNGIYSEVTQDTLKEPHWEHIFYMMHRLFEAHFLPIHMMVLVFASALFLWAIDGKEDPHHLGRILSACNILRTIGFMFMAIYIWLYESYHRICVKSREVEMRKAGLDQGMCFSHRSLRQNCFDYFLVPIVAPLFGSIPCVQAEISHLWTVHLTYTVSKKATRQVQKLETADHMA